MKRKKLKILGTEYAVFIGSRKEFPYLEECDGYCDKTTKEIVVVDCNTLSASEITISAPMVYQKKIMRHEIIHAFLFESGLHECFGHDTGHDETYVDWFAVQAPKIYAAFAEMGCLDG